MNIENILLFFFVCFIFLIWMIQPYPLESSIQSLHMWPIYCHVIRPTGQAREMDISILYHFVLCIIFPLFSGYILLPGLIFIMLFWGGGKRMRNSVTQHWFKNTFGFQICLQNYVHNKTGKISHTPKEKTYQQTTVTTIQLSLKILFFTLAKYETRLLSNHPSRSLPSCNIGWETTLEKYAVPDVRDKHLVPM